MARQIVWIQQIFYSESICYLDGSNVPNMICTTTRISQHAFVPRHDAMIVHVSKTYAIKGMTARHVSAFKGFKKVEHSNGYCGANTIVFSKASQTTAMST
jgi:hypothetical protein